MVLPIPGQPTSTTFKLSKSRKSMQSSNRLGWCQCEGSCKPYPHRGESGAKSSKLLLTIAVSDSEAETSIRVLEACIEVTTVDLCLTLLQVSLPRHRINCPHLKLWGSQRPLRYKVCVTKYPTTDPRYIQILQHLMLGRAIVGTGR